MGEEPFCSSREGDQRTTVLLSSLTFTLQSSDWSYYRERPHQTEIRRITVLVRCKMDYVPSCLSTFHRGHQLLRHLQRPADATGTPFLVRDYDLCCLARAARHTYRDPIIVREETMGSGGILVS